MRLCAPRCGRGKSNNPINFKALCLPTDIAKKSAELLIDHADNFEQRRALLISGRRDSDPFRADDRQQHYSKYKQQ